VPDKHHPDEIPKLDYNEQQIAMENEHAGDRLSDIDNENKNNSLIPNVEINYQN